MFKWFKRLGDGSKPHFELSDNNSGPVFVFAACWRTGSTLVQRIINASGEVFVWGEPAFLPEAKSLHDRSESFFMTAAKNRKQGMGRSTGQWIPIACPLPERLVPAMRAYFETLYLSEAQEMGFNRWGFKEVRPGAREHIELLAKIFPQARFVFLIRDPYETFRSIKGKKFHARFKDPYQPVRVWRSNVEGCLLGGLASIVPMHVLRYELLTSSDQVARETIEAMADFLSIRVTERMFDELSVQVDSSGKDKRLDAQEIADIDAIVSETAEALGYHKPVAR